MISIVIDSKVSRWTREIKYVFGFIFQTLGYNFSFSGRTGRFESKRYFADIYGYTEPTPEELKGLANIISIFHSLRSGFF